MYRVWRKDEFDELANEDERADRAWSGFKRESPDEVEEAAEAYADHCHRQRDGWDWSWPVDFVVHDGHKYFVVEVDRESLPHFYSIATGELVVKE